MRLKAYLQAGLHANEIPGLLVLHHLLSRLLEADRAGRNHGEICQLFVRIVSGTGVPKSIGWLSLDRGHQLQPWLPDLALLGGVSWRQSTTMRHDRFCGQRQEVLAERHRTEWQNW